MWIPGVGVEGLARVSPEPETMRILSGWGCNMSRAVQASIRRGGEKPRGWQVDLQHVVVAGPRLFFGRVAGSVPGVRKQGVHNESESSREAIQSR
jgi:hypothetical protein